VAAAAEKALANTIHSLPDEVVLYWGEAIGTHGSDVVSYNLETKRITLWDAKYRGDAVGIAGSKTFTDKQRLSNALVKAKDAIYSSSLSAEDKAAAINSIKDKLFNTRTAGMGSAKNSTFGDHK